MQESEACPYSFLFPCSASIIHNNNTISFDQNLTETMLHANKTKTKPSMFQSVARTPINTLQYPKQIIKQSDIRIHSSSISCFKSIGASMSVLG
jgi:hypothetical protein